MSEFPPFNRRPRGALAVPTAQVIDEPTVCVRLNREWSSYVAGILERLGEYSHYEQDTAEEREQIYQNTQDLIALYTDAIECAEPMTVIHDLVQAVHFAPANNPGGATVAGAWTPLPLNNVAINSVGALALAGNVLTIEAGRWSFMASHVFRHVTAHSSRLQVKAAPQSNPGGFLVFQSTNARMVGDNYTLPIASGVFEYAEPILVWWEYYVSAAQVVNGLGLAINFLGLPELYGDITLQRVRIA